MDKVVVENVNVPGQTSRVDAAKYQAMREAMLAVLPASAPGVSWKELLDKLVPTLPQDLWPGGEKAGWWAKTVQLDLEAKGLIQRAAGAKPLRWTRRP